MHIKGINPFEKHVEKGVLAVVGAAALGILAWQFVGPPNTVKVKNDEVPIDQAYVKLKDQAESVQARIRAPEFTPPDDIPVIEMRKTFQQRLAGPVARTRQLAWAGEAAASIFTGGASPVGTPTRYVVKPVEPPAPAAPKAMTYLACISPAEVEAAPELAAHLPPAMPFDKAAVSVESTFNGVEFQRILASDPDGDGPLSPLPQHWWGSLVQILAVELQREELQPDGTWSNLQTVPPLPGRYSLHDEIAAGIPNLTELARLSAEATQNAAAIRRTPYYSIVFGEEWVPPSEMRLDFRPPTQAEINRWTREHQDATDQIARLQAQLTEIPADDPRRAAQRRNLEERIQQQTERLARARAELRNLGAPVEGDVQDAGIQEVVTADPPLFSDRAVRVWAHDITAERGKTYRYRVVLVFPNPLFGQAAAIAEDLAPLAADPVVRSIPSPWSEPVTVDPETYFFISSAQDQPVGGGLAGGPRAAAELYVFRWGYWRKDAITLEPGDPVAGLIRVPDFAAMRPDLVTPPGQNQDPAALPADPVQPVENPNEPLNIIYTQVPVARDAYLLDVAAVPAVRSHGLGSGGGNHFQAFIRDSDGGIVVRNPDPERQGQAYMQVARSAALGEQALRPKPIVRRPVPRPTDRPDDRPVTGKGGGASGGG